MTVMDVSIVIVNWNTRDILRNCLKSIYEQTQDVNFEVIVVDNASSDGSAGMVKQEFPQAIQIANHKNRGFAAANNQGIHIAQGRYVCLVNSDILFLEDSLRPMFNYMDNHPEVGMLGPKLLWQDQTLQGSCRKFPSLWNTFCPAIGLTSLFPKVSFFGGEHMVGYFKHDQIKDVDALVGAFLMVRQSALKQIGDMDDKYFMYCEEVDWCKRFVAAGWKVRFFPETKVIHYGRGSSSVEPVRFFREHCLSNLRYWHKHHTNLSIAAYRLLMIIRYLIRLPLWAVVFMIRRSDAWKAKLGIATTGLQIFTNFSKSKLSDAQFSTPK